ncbi:MAG: ATP-binding protein, partial [Anaerolineae bacterium]|nr:ATP-binding protein [Anaerolineae bacterium]
ISVSDTGPGIPADQLEHIFDEFYQVDRSLHRKHGGAGLGLAISKGFVEAHGGRIWVESREGEGATFTFTLPIPGEGPAVSRLRVERPLQPLPSEARPCILAVDRDPSVATFIQRHLEGHEVVPVQDAGRLEEEVKLYHPQAIVWNVQPGGFRGNGTDPATPVPVIECTLPSQSWLADNLSVKACLTKPVTTEQLLNEIARLGEVRDILIVDDDRDFCQLVERMLASSRGAYRIRRAYSGPDGLQATRAQRPDLVLLDLVMPGLDGFQVLEELRADEDLARVPVVLLTATSVAEDILSLRGSQMLIHRSDGLRPVEVLRCIQALVGVLQPRYDERSAPADLTPHPTGAVPPGPHPG